MEPLDAYRKLARSVPRAQFLSRHPNPFLVKRPTAVASAGSDDPWDDKFQFRTRIYEDMDDPDLEDELGPMAAEWRVVEVKKREGNPFPDRISVGRAKNCDVVLRFPSVSKLHAHFLVRPGEGYRLMDQQSANGTRVSGRPLAAGETAVVQAGDVLRFGAVDLELYDAARLYNLLLGPT